MKDGDSENNVRDVLVVKSLSVLLEFVLDGRRNSCYISSTRYLPCYSGDSHASIDLAADGECTVAPYLTMATDGEYTVASFPSIFDPHSFVKPMQPFNVVLHANALICRCTSGCGDFAEVPSLCPDTNIMRLSSRRRL